MTNTTAEHRPRGSVGFVTRVVAMVCDEVVINVVALVLLSAVRLVLTRIGDPRQVISTGELIGGGTWFLLVTVGYYVSFWNVTGQTLGAHLMGIRVVRQGDFGDLGAVDAWRRMLGFVLASIPVGLGFLPVLVTERRRGLHDWIGGTVVMWDVPEWRHRGRQKPAGHQ
jgi:uncharacterized RDD family membrane protein YckC